MCDITSVATYVFFDLESTGLLEDKPRITELSLVAVNAYDMRSPGIFPRVVNKLSLCFDPQKRISLESSNITGLYNDNLEFQQPFTESTAALLRNFLEHLPEPVCLLAHYGNGFDFSLLQAELLRVRQCLSDNLLCADTLEAFRSLDGLTPRHEAHSGQPVTPGHQNGHARIDQTPSSNKTYTPSHPPVLKRKSDEEMPSNIMTVSKKAKMGDINASNPAAEKVKKRLFVSEDKECNSDEWSEIDEEEYCRELDVIDGVQIKQESTKLDDGYVFTGHSKQNQENETLVLKVAPAEASQRQGNHSISLLSNEVDSEETLDPDDVGSLSFSEGNCEEGSLKIEDGLSTESSDPLSSSQDLTPEHVKDNGYVLAASGYMVQKHSPSGVTSPGSQSHKSQQVTSPGSLSHKSQQVTSPGSLCHKSKQVAVLPAVPGTSAPNSGNKISVNNAIVQENGAVTMGTRNVTLSNSSSKKTYGLAALYFNLFGRYPLHSHRAEDDCLSLMQVAKCTSGFMEWVNKHAVPFSSIEPPSWAKQKFSKKNI